MEPAPELRLSSLERRARSPIAGRTGWIVATATLGPTWARPAREVVDAGRFELTSDDPDGTATRLARALDR